MIEWIGQKFASKQIKPLLVILMVSGMSSNCTQKTSDRNECAVTRPGVQHGIVYHQEDRFAAWPANNGIWHWGNDEILVGFKEGEHDESTPGLHKIDWDTECGKYARSLDGGLTWQIEDAYQAGQTTMGKPDQKRDSLKALTNSISNFLDSGFVLTFKREGNHRGFSHFYYSKNRGKKWLGPYEFPHLDLPGIVTRTDYIIESAEAMEVFLTVTKTNMNEGRVAIAKTQNGALTWRLVTMIGAEPTGFDIMPSSVKLAPSELFTTIRTRTGGRQDKITAYYSSDNGENWVQVRDPVADTGRGGSPPALLKMRDGRLALAYAYRSEYGSRMNLRFSTDNGETWSDEIVVRGGDGANRDAGYPVMVQRTDGKLVIVYYWNHALANPSESYRYIACSIVDPKLTVN